MLTDFWGRGILALCCLILFVIIIGMIIWQLEVRYGVLFAAIFGSLSILAFLSAYIILAYIYGSGDILEGLKMLLVDLVGKRTFGDSQNYDATFADSLNASVLEVINYYIGFGGNEEAAIIFMVFVTTIVELIFRKCYLKKECKFEISIFAVSLLSTFSLIVLAKGIRMFAHLNFVLFYMGWVQCSAYIIIATLMEKVGKR